MKTMTHPTLFWTAAGIFAASTGAANAAVYNNANGTGLWSDSGNWTGSDIADNNTEAAQINPAAIEVDNNFTINRLQNSFGSSATSITGAGTLTIDRNNANAQPAIFNATGNAGSTMLVDINIVINNNLGGISQIRNNNSSSNVLIMGPNSTLDLQSDVEVVQQAGGSVQFNGTLLGSENLRFNHNNVSFGTTSDSPSYSGEMVFLGGANVTVDTSNGNIFFGGSKLQFNGNTTLTLNNADVIANAPLIGTSGSPAVNLNINANQTFGNLNLGGADINITLGASVTSLDFGPSSAFSWTGGSLNINNYAPGILGFGFEGGLSEDQLGQITVDGAAPDEPLFLDANGKLVPEPGSLAFIVGGLGLFASRRRA